MQGDDLNYIPPTAWGRLALIPAKLRARGFGWLWKRVGEETSRVIRLAFAMAGYLRRRVIHFIVRSQSSRGTLYAIYDLESYPISYDILWFLVWADIERKRRALNNIQCVFVPCRDEASREYPAGYDAVVDSQSRTWRFNNICVSATGLIPGVGATVCSARALADDLVLIARERMPTGSPPSLSEIYRQTTAGLKAQGQNWSGLSASVQGRRYVSQWLETHVGERKPVVITLRQYGVDIERNSNLAEWSAFAHSLDPDIYQPIIIPDTDHSVAPMPGFGELPHFTPAAWNVGLRMAIYEMAYVNMFVNSGPGSLCILNRQCRYLFFKVTAPTYLASEDMLRQMGFERGTSPVFATPYQKWVWETDERTILRREFDAMAAMIDDMEEEDIAHGVSPRRDRFAA